VPQRNPEASDVEEGSVGGEQMLMANHQSAELTKPCVGPLYDPTAFISSEFPSIFVAPCFVVLPIGHDEIDAALFESLP